MRTLESGGEQSKQFPCTTATRSPAKPTFAMESGVSVKGARTLSGQKPSRLLLTDVALESERKSSLKRTHTLTSAFYGLAFDENHLAGLAAKLKQLTGSFEAKVVAADGIETTETDVPESLADESTMPHKIKSVQMNAYRRYSSPVPLLKTTTPRLTLIFPWMRQLP